MSYEFEMPWPPTVNHYHQPVRIGKSARIIKGQKAREYSSLIIKHMTDLCLDSEAISERLSVSIVLNPPTLRKYDVDNRTKAIFDALSDCGFWLDDEQVDRLIVTKGVKTKGGNVKIKVEVIQ